MTPGTPDADLLAAVAEALDPLWFVGVSDERCEMFAALALAAAGRVLAAQADERNDLTADDIRRLCGVPEEAS